MTSRNVQALVTRAGGESQDFARLERAVRELVAQHAALGGENALLREELDQAGDRIRRRDQRILAENQRRQDVLKRLDELLARIEQRAPQALGGRLGRR